MFRLIITSFYLFLTFSGCTQKPVLGKLDSTDFNHIIALPEYNVKRCIEEVLEIIALSDTSGLRFPSDRYCFEILFSDFGSYRQMVITPSRWPRIMSKDCKGMIAVKGAYFLLYSSFTSDSLFAKRNNDVTKSVVQVQSHHFDSLDAKVNWKDWKDSPTAVVGELRSCQGAPINLYINIGLNLKPFFGN
jgi:hypothetical protein